MKTLKQLKEQCVLLASFSEPAFVVIDGSCAIHHRRANTAYLFYDNCSTYYFYYCIDRVRIRYFFDHSSAYDHFVTFVNNILKG